MGAAPPLLLDPAERLERLAAAGVAVTVVQHFDEALRRTPYDVFVERIRARATLARVPDDARCGVRFRARRHAGRARRPRGARWLRCRGGPHVQPRRPGRSKLDHPGGHRLGRPRGREPASRAAGDDHGLDRRRRRWPLPARFQAPGRAAARWRLPGHVDGTATTLRIRRAMPTCSASIPTGASRSSWASPDLVPSRQGRAATAVRGRRARGSRSEPSRTARRQPVEVGEDGRADLLLAGELDCLAFGPPADRPRNVELGRPGRATRQQEVGRVARRPSLNSSMRPSSFSMWRVSTVGTGARLAGRRRREIRPEIEQLVLDEGQLRGEPLAQPSRGPRRCVS